MQKKSAGIGARYSCWTDGDKSKTESGRCGFMPFFPMTSFPRRAEIFLSSRLRAWVMCGDASSCITSTYNRKADLLCTTNRGWFPLRERGGNAPCFLCIASPRISARWIWFAWIRSGDHRRGRSVFPLCVRGEMIHFIHRVDARNRRRCRTLFQQRSRWFPRWSCLVEGPSVVPNEKNISKKSRIVLEI